MDRDVRGDPRGFIARVDAAIARQGLQVYEFSERIGQAGSYWSQWKSRHKVREAFPRGDTLMAMKSVLDVPLAYLLGLPASAGDEDLAVEPSRPRLLTEADLYERFGIKPYEQPSAIEGVVMSAGPGAGVPQDLDYTLPRRVKGSRYLWEAPVIGDCMADDIKPGEVVIYSTRLGAELGKVMVALRDEEELIIKRLLLAGDKQVLRPNHGQDVPVDDRIRFLGRGVSVQRALL